MKLNIEKWNKKRLEVEEEIRKLKEILQTPGHMGTTRQWLELNDLAYEATDLYMLRAELRGEGRLHCTKVIEYVSDPRGGEHRGMTVPKVVSITRDDQRKRAFANDWHLEYLKPECPPVAVSA